VKDVLRKGEGGTRLENIKIGVLERVVTEDLVRSVMGFSGEGEL
jgi:hypothetical protein